ncbi:flavin reductase family protein [Streptomyces montanus]|nr:flavin reductase family protein [Streptomyces montanus]
MTESTHCDLSARFRDAMAAFPSGVTIMTTADRSGRPWGFTASSFCSLSLDPPLVLVCLAKTARCHPAFRQSDDWTIQIVAPRHLALVTRFATSGADKFTGNEFVPDERGVPVLPDAPVTLACSAHARYDGGDHSILVARVHDVTLLDDQPLLYFRRSFQPLAELSAGPHAP